MTPFLLPYKWQVLRTDVVQPIIIIINYLPDNNNQRPRTAILPPSLLRIDREIIADANSTHDMPSYTSNLRAIVTIDHSKNEASISPPY